MKGGDEVRLSNTSKRKQEMARRKEQRKMDLERKRKERGKHSINIFMVWQRTPLLLVLTKNRKKFIHTLFRRDIVTCKNCNSGYTIT